MIRFRWMLLLPGLLLANESMLWAESTQEQARAIVAGSLKYIEQGAEEWKEEHGCLSCHRGSFTAWTLNRATERGFEVPKEELQQWNAWATNWMHMVRPADRKNADKEKTLMGANDTIAQLMLGRPHSSKPAEPYLKEFREALLSSQNDDGSWNAGGQLPSQKRAARETKEVSTMWAMLALLDAAERYGNRRETGGAIDGKSRDAESDSSKSIKRARDWIGSKTKGDSLEWWATRMLVDRALGDKLKADAARKKILAMQREDGGWGWLLADKSDALGTGIAVYALVRDGMPRDDRCLSDAIKFLASTRRDDGSWLVHGTKKSGRDDEVETAVYWGACWAVIGALEWLGQG